MNKIDRMKELTGILNEASRVYYSGTDEIMSNYEYDRMYDELLELEKDTGIRMSDSPTVKVGYEVAGELPKENHELPMLSLDKTKSVEALADFAGSKRCILSWKLDGLTVVLTYDGGGLVKAVTRGNGYVGEVVTANARTFKNLPLRIPFKGRLVIRGEALITYSDFEKINSEITSEEDKYKNPRNLCSGSVRQLNSKVTASRNVKLVVFSMIKAYEAEKLNSMEERFEWLENQGFEVVERKKVTREDVADAVKDFSEKIKNNDFPSDGLVLTYDDIAYGESLGTTAKFPRNAIAFKWQDETAETVLRKIEWSASRTGLINPVAVFDPVELEGTTVSRASVHNVSIVRELKLGTGDRIKVYKANMIIPQIAENLTGSGSAEIPEKCPVCGGITKTVQTAGAVMLYCTNEECQAKNVKKFQHFVERNALNIEGISEQTLEKFIDMGFIKEFYDIYHLDRYRDKIVSMDGFGEKSYENIIESIEKSRNTTLANVIYGLGIEGIGPANAKLICRSYDDDPDKITSCTAQELLKTEGIGEVLAGTFTDYFRKEHNTERFYRLLSELKLQREERKELSGISGRVFVITGSVNHFANRDELKSFIEKAGGKTAGTVSRNTDYLINNDVTSTSSKNKKAMELGVTIISEEEFLKLTGGIE